MKKMPNKKRLLFKPFAFLAVFMLVVTLGFAAIDPLLTKLRKSSARYKSELNCFLGGVTKCGKIDATESEIINEIKHLDLSFKEARLLILKAQEGSRKRIEGLEQKDNLTDQEESLKKKMELSQPYYQRVLETIDKMGKE